MFTDEQKSKVEEIIKHSLRNKFQSYNPEGAYMPFHTRLLGSDRMALFSFIQSLNTNFGTSIFEPLAKLIASEAFKYAENQKNVPGVISSQAEIVIQDIMNNLESATCQPNKQEEIERIRDVCRAGEMKKVRPTRVDLWLESNDSELFLFDIKSAKPNKGNFLEYKRTMLRWVACVLSENPNTKVNTLIAIPYNPYEPKPYSRWTIRGMLDLEYELKVAENFWNFLIGGKDIFNDLLDCFERVGIELRPEIDEYFAKYNITHH